MQNSGSRARATLVDPYPVAKPAVRTIWRNLICSLVATRVFTALNSFILAQRLVLNAAVAIKCLEILIPYAIRPESDLKNLPWKI